MIAMKNSIVVRGYIRKKRNPAVVNIPFRTRSDKIAHMYDRMMKSFIDSSMM